MGELVALVHARSHSYCIASFALTGRCGPVFLPGQLQQRCRFANEPEPLDFQLRYRAEIDGLRAVAVLSVLFYHLRIPSVENYAAPGGFLGVDVFFVLSGFLITSIVAVEINKTGRLNLGAFYLRRARRILPPLILVILASIPAAWAILLPSDMPVFASSLWAALGFFSNFFWAGELRQYGAAPGLLQPFLHTWSLAIEEQFYLIFPLVLLLVLRRIPDRASPCMAAIVLGGFLVAQATTIAWQDWSFFSPLSRAWELGAGAWLALAGRDFREWAGKSNWGRFLPTIGLATIIASVSFAKIGMKLHPGLVTIPAIAGTCAIIAFSTSRDPATRVLSARPFVIIGKLSYSLYLWHFPIFAFGRMLAIEPPGPADWAIWMMLAFALSAAGYWLVERPMRFSMPARPFLVATGAGALAVIASPFVLHAVDMDQAPRSRALARVYGDIEFDNGQLKEASWEVLSSLSSGEEGTEQRAHTPSPSERDELWFSPQAKQRVLVVGNSHSKDLFNALYLNRQSFHGAEFARFGMDSRFLPKQLEMLYASKNYQAADIVMLAPKYRADSGILVPAIAAMKADGKRVLLVGNNAEFLLSNGLPPFDQETRRRGRVLTDDEANRFAFARLDPEVSALNARLRQLADEQGIAYLSRFDLVCAPGRESCTNPTPSGRKAYYDGGHWTLEGARYFGQRAAEEGWAEALGSAQPGKP